MSSEAHINFSVINPKPIIYIYTEDRWIDGRFHKARAKATLHTDHRDSSDLRESCSQMLAIPTISEHELFLLAGH